MLTKPGCNQGEDRCGTADVASNPSYSSKSEFDPWRNCFVGLALDPFCPRRAEIEEMQAEALVATWISCFGRSLSGSHNLTQKRQAAKQGFC